MNLLIDASAIKSKVTGAGKYATRLLLALAEIDSQNQYTILLDESLPADHPILGLQKYEGFRLIRIDIPAIGPKRQWLFYRKIRNRINYDVFHCLLSNYPLSMRNNGVATIYDLKYLLYPHFLGRYHLIKSYYILLQESHRFA